MTFLQSVGATMQLDVANKKVERVTSYTFYFKKKEKIGLRPKF